jgi:ADP-heptose:LPS heptosyltransferase
MGRRVLVARLDSAGDVLLAGPAIRAIVAARAHVTLLVGPRGVAAAELLPGVDEIITYRAEWIDPDPRPLSAERTLGLVRELARRELDEAIILVSFHQSPLPLALLLRMAGVPRIGAICDDYPGSLLDVRHQVSGDLHEVERGLSLAAACGYSVAADDDRRLALRPLSGCMERPFAEPFVVVHPGASVSARAWEPESAAAFVRLLLDGGFSVVVTGGALERSLCARVAGRPHRRLRNLAGATTMEQLAALIAMAQGIVVGNTGPAHLAAAVQTPVVSVYAPTVPAARWRPWAVPHELLYREVPCAGCRARICPVPGHPCVGGVSAQEALAALRRLTDAAEVAA